MFLVVGVAFAWGSTAYSFGSSARPGPGYFPFGLGVILAILGAIELFKALAIESEGGDPIGGVAWRVAVFECPCCAATDFRAIAGRSV